MNQQTNEEVDIHCQKLVIAADPVAAKGLLHMVKKNSNESSYFQDKIAIPKGRGYEVRYCIDKLLELILNCDFHLLIIIGILY